MIIRRQIPGPRSAGSPYIPVITYTTAWPMVMIIPNTRERKDLIKKRRKGIRYVMCLSQLLTLLRSIEESSVFWTVTNFNNFRTCQKLKECIKLELSIIFN